MPRQLGAAAGKQPHAATAVELIARRSGEQDRLNVLCYSRSTVWNSRQSKTDLSTTAELTAVAGRGLVWQALGPPHFLDQRGNHGKAVLGEPGGAECEMANAAVLEHG
jgi:hypothetical protein